MFGMFKSKPKEKWKVKVVKAFTDTYAGMAGDDWDRHVPVGAEGIATISGEKHVTVKFNDIKDDPYDRPLEVYFTRGSSEEHKFEFTEQLPQEEVNPKIKKSNIFG